MKRGRYVLFLAVVLTSSAACNLSVQSTERPAETVRTQQNGAVPIGHVATTTAAPTVPTTPAVITPIPLRADAMTELSPAHLLPVSVSVRSPVSVTRTPEGEWLVRATVRVVNDAATPAMVERALFAATVAGTALTSENVEQGFDAEIPLATGQVANGSVAWRVPAGIASPNHVTIAYGLPSARVSAEISAE